MGREARGERVDEWLARRRITGEPRGDPHHAGAADAILTRDQLARADADRRGQRSVEPLGERRGGPCEHVRHPAGRADRTRGVILVGAIQAERGERRIARQHLGNASVLHEEARQIVEDAPLDRPQALGIERTVAAGDLGELDVDDAHEPAVGTALELEPPGTGAARAGSATRVAGGSSAGSCSRIARSSSRSAVPGSRPCASRSSERRSR